MLFGVSPKERSAETGVSKTTLYAKANLFDQAGMASLLPPTPPPEIPKQDKRTLPPPMRQAIVDAHAEYPGLSLHEIARICYVQFNRRLSHHTIQLMLAEGPSPSRTMRRFPRFDEIADPAERRRVFIRLHAECWMPPRLPSTWAPRDKPCIARSDGGWKNSSPVWRINLIRVKGAPSKQISEP